MRERREPSSRCVLARRELVMGGVGVAQARSRVDVPVLAGKRTGNIKAGGATALAAGARDVCVDVRAVCPFLVRFGLVG